jgi:hypothetical protein
LLMRPFS